MTLTRDERRRLEVLGARSMLAELDQRKASLFEAYPELKPQPVANGTPQQRPRRRMSRKMRKLVSERMKKYWAERRKAGRK